MIQPLAAVPSPTTPPAPFNQNQGLVRVMNNAQMVAQEQADAARKASEQQQAQPIVINIAAHVRNCFEVAQTARQPHETDMLRALRMRNGEYDPEILTEIKKQGGSEVYMRIGSTKMRGAQSWLKDIYLNIERPWILDPTPMPSLMDDVAPLVEQQLQMLMAAAQTQGVPPPQQAELDQIRSEMTDKANAEVLQKARDMAERASLKVDDILVEGGFYKALDECLTDLTTFKVCVMKGPVVRMKKRVSWGADATGKHAPQVKTDPVQTFSRVSPLAYYPAPNAINTDDGFTIQRHKLFRSDLVALLDTPGFDSNAIRQVLTMYGQGGLNEWLSVDSQEAIAINGTSTRNDSKTSPTIDALEYWGSIQGQMLLDWGMDNTAVPDALLEYPVNVWVIGPYVIKAMLNADPLSKIPFSVTSLVKVPGSVWGEGLGEQLRDVQQVCNAASRSLVNNMALASGPMVGIDVSRLPQGETITSLHPWRIFQFLRDLTGGSSKPIEFFQPQSNATELNGVYEKFSTLADEYSNIPRYMLGDNSVGGAGRTAAGLSMLMNAANKGIKNVANNIDTDLIVPTIERLYYSTILNDPDPTIKGDVQIRARGASGLMLKELLNQRRIEFMAQVPALEQMGVIKPEGVAALMREIVKGLEMPQGEIVPSDAEIKQMQLAKQQAIMAEQQMAAQQAELAGQDDIVMKHDANGRMIGATVKSKGGSPKKPVEPQTQDQQLRSLTTGPRPQ